MISATSHDMPTPAGHFAINLDTCAMDVIAIAITVLVLERLAPCLPTCLLFTLTVSLVTVAARVQGSGCAEQFATPAIAGCNERPQQTFMSKLWP